MENIFQIFGSKSSQDVDIMVFVDSIPDKPHISHELETRFNILIKEFIQTDKEVNSNLAVLENGIITKVFKGTCDEVNNSLLKTYRFHTQYHPCLVKNLIERDIDLKILRTCRVLLSLISRTEYRMIIKPALQGDFNERVKALYLCDISKIKPNDFINKNVSYIDFIKVYAFQIAQTLALIEKVELYTKEEINAYYPELEPFINRDINADINVLEKWKIKLLDTIKDYPLKSLVE